jgi:hypothetical protein
MALKMGFLNQLLMNLALIVRATTCASARAVAVEALPSGAGGMRIARSRCTTESAFPGSIPENYVQRLFNVCFRVVQHHAGPPMF